VSKPVSLHEEASAELELAVEWYAERSVPAGERLLDDALELLDRIGEAPHAFPIHTHGTRRAVMPTVYPYSIVYLDENECVFVVAFVHARRRPGYWLHRL
jgi:toxin ParE1/3/4